MCWKRERDVVDVLAVDGDGRGERGREWDVYYPVSSVLKVFYTDEHEISACCYCHSPPMKRHRL